MEEINIEEYNRLNYQEETETNWAGFVTSHVDCLMITDAQKAEVIDRILNDEESKAIWINDPETAQKRFTRFIIETNLDQWSQYVNDSEIPQPFKGGVIRANEMMLIWVKNPTAMVAIVDELKAEYVKNAVTINTGIDHMMGQIQKFTTENYRL